MKALIIAAMLTVSGQAFALGLRAPDFETSARAAASAIISLSVYDYMIEKGKSSNEAAAHAMGLSMILVGMEAVVSGFDYNKMGAGMIGASLPIVVKRF